MRLLIVMVFGALASTNSFGKDNPLDHLTVTSTRLKCRSGFAVVTYGYRREASHAAKTKLAFVVIETDEFNSRFQTVFALSSKVDDVTPPAYLALEENTVDLPSENQVHEISRSQGRYRQTDSDVTLHEIRAWLDQAEILATADSLLEYKAKMRARNGKSSG